MFAGSLVRSFVRRKVKYLKRTFVYSSGYVYVFSSQTSKNMIWAKAFHWITFFSNAFTLQFCCLSQLRAREEKIILRFMLNKVTSGYFCTIIILTLKMIDRKHSNVVSVPYWHSFGSQCCECFCKQFKNIIFFRYAHTRY